MHASWLFCLRCYLRMRVPQSHLVSLENVWWLGCWFCSEVGQWGHQRIPSSRNHDRGRMGESEQCGIDKTVLQASLRKQGESFGKVRHCDMETAIACIIVWNSGLFECHENAHQLLSVSHHKLNILLHSVKIHTRNPSLQNHAAESGGFSWFNWLEFLLCQFGRAWENFSHRKSNYCQIQCCYQKSIWYVSR